MTKNLSRIGLLIGLPLTFASTNVFADDPANSKNDLNVTKNDLNVTSSSKVRNKKATTTNSKKAVPENSIETRISPQARTRKLVRTYATEEQITWKPLFHQYDSIKLSIVGPGIEPFETTFEKGEQITFGIYDEESEIWSDGVFKWELTAKPTVSDETRELMQEERNQTSIVDMGSVLRDSGLLPTGQDMKQSGTFAIVDGQLVRPKGERESRREQERMATVEAAGFAADRDPLPNGVQLRDQVFLDDLIVNGSGCVGQDCVNGESFGFDTLRIKENNLRIHFEDTSTSASFPSTDWRIIINDSANGGGNYFGIEDSSAGRIPFRVEAGAPANTLYVEADGDVGIKTSNPVVDLHIVEGNTPTVRLEQDGSDGFTAQTWDLAGNETNFFVRDATNGSRLPFRIKPSAPTNSVFIAADGDVGIGTDSPSTPLHVRRTDGTAQVKIEEASGSATSRRLLHVVNNGDAIFRLENTDSEIIWDFKATEDATLVIDNPDNVGSEFELQEDGSLVVSGTVIGSSDRNVKQDVEDLDYQQLLQKVADLPVKAWSYKQDKNKARHIGPMAQDFSGAFGLGFSDKHIAFSDASGVALAAIKGLHEVVTQKNAELEALRSKTSALEEQVKLLIEKVGADSGVD